MSSELSDEQLRAIYAWIDAIPLSRPKKNMARDFSDGVMLAEVVAAYFPQLVEVHNYPAANNIRQKIYNHDTLNTKVLKKLGFTIPRETIEDIVNAKAGVIEGVLNTLQIKMAKYRERKANGDDQSQRESVPPERQNKVPLDKYGVPEAQSVQAPQRQANKPTSSVPATNHAPVQRNSQKNNVVASVDEELLLEKEQTIRDLQETVEILELKIAKLEQLVRLKDSKIQKLQQAR